MCTANRVQAIFALNIATWIAGCVPQSTGGNTARYALIEQCTRQAHRAYPSQGSFGQDTVKNRTFAYEACMHSNGQEP
jgi:hypothetical protein